MRHNALKDFRGPQSSTGALWVKMKMDLALREFEVPAAPSSIGLVTNPRFKHYTSNYFIIKHCC